MAGVKRGQKRSGRGGEECVRMNGKGMVGMACKGGKRGEK